MKFLHMIINLFKRKNIIPQDIRGTTITDKDIIDEIIKEVSTPLNQKTLDINKDARELLKRLQKMGRDLHEENKMGTGNLTIKVESELINAIAICKSCGKTRITGEVCDVYPDNYIKTRLEDMIFIENPCECGCDLFDIDAVVKVKLKY